MEARQFSALPSALPSKISMAIVIRGPCLEFTFFRIRERATDTHLAKRIPDSEPKSEMLLGLTFGVVTPDDWVVSRLLVYLHLTATQFVREL